jgi:hypothetical protein
MTNTTIKSAREIVAGVILVEADGFMWRVQAVRRNGVDNMIWSLDPVESSVFSRAHELRIRGRQRVRILTQEAL